MRAIGWFAVVLVSVAVAVGAALWWATPGDGVGDLTGRAKSREEAPLVVPDAPSLRAPEVVPPAGETPADRVAEPADPGDAILDVTVIDEDGQPIAGYAFEAIVQPDDEDEERSVHGAQTDARGRAEVSVPAPSTLYRCRSELQLDPPTTGLLRPSPGDFPPGDRLEPGTRHAVVLRAARGAALRVRVLDPNGAPIEGARVEVYRELPHHRFFPHASQEGWLIATGNPERTVAMEPTGEPVPVPIDAGCSLLACAEGYLEHDVLQVGNVDVASLHGRTVDLVLHDTFEMTVHVTDPHGAPVDECSVFAQFGPPRRNPWDPKPPEPLERIPARPLIGSTDVTGTFRGALPRVLHTVQVNGSGWVGERHDVEPATPLLRLALRAAGQLTGRVLDARGAPIPLAYVKFVGGAEEVLASDQADDDGHFTLADIDPAMSGDLLVHAQGHAPHLLGPFRPALRADAPIEVRLAAPEVLDGVVVDARGDPVAGASVEIEGERRLTSASTGEHPPRTLEQFLQRDRRTTDAAGRFAFAELPPGTFRLRVTHEGGRTKTVLPAGTRGIRMTLEP